MFNYSKRQLKRMFNFFKIVFRALKIEGGLLKALIKTLNIYKNFGLVGLRRSFKYLFPAEELTQ